MQEWTPVEDHILMTVIRDMPKKSWMKMQVHFPYRSVSSIRNRYQRLTKKNHTIPPKQKCRYCGEFRRGHICSKNLLCEKILVAQDLQDPVVEVNVQDDTLNVQDDTLNLFCEEILDEQDLQDSVVEVNVQDDTKKSVHDFVDSVGDDYVLQTPFLLTAARLSQISQ